jgi:hypothetical protein
MRHVRFSISRTNHVLSQLAPQEWVDYWDECLAATIGLGHNAEQLSLVRRSFLSPVIGNCVQFQEYVDGGTNVGWNYWRFWHGYQILSRPLLYIGTLYELHYFAVILFVLSGAFFASQVSRFSSSCAWALLIAFFCVPVLPQMAIISDAVLWVIAFSIGGWLLLPSTNRAGERDSLYVCFLVSGMLCSFCGFLTVPLITLTVPLVGLYWKGEFGADNEKLTVRSIIILSVVWLAGYSLCWAAKWAIAGAVGERGVIAEISQVIQHRIGIGGGPLGDTGGDLSVSATRSIVATARTCWYGWLIVIGLAIARTRQLVAAMLSKKRWSFSSVAVPLVLFGMPIVWLAVLQQHSIWHAWFVARIYFTSFAIMLAVILTPGRDERARATAPSSSGTDNYAYLLTQATSLAQQFRERTNSRP